MRKVLFDTNIILDIALKRHPFFDDALEMFGLIDRKIIIGSVTATTITDIYYISRKAKGDADSINFIKGLIEVVDIVGVDKNVIINALASGLKDFEDGIQASASELNGVEVIITRNKDDFANARLKIATPKEFLIDLK